MTHLKEETQAINDEQKGQQGSPLIVNSAKIEESQFANLTIKVRKRQRLHWLIEAKKQGTSLTAAITDALNERFGAPE